MKITPQNRQKVLLIAVAAGVLLLVLDRVAMYFSGVWSVRSAEIVKLSKDVARGRSMIERAAHTQRAWNEARFYGMPVENERRRSLVVVRQSQGRIGLLVDRLHGEHQTVIKPLGRMFRSLRGMSGSSILGNGEVALIFDVHALCQLAERPPGPVARSNPHGSPSVADLS